MAVVPADSSLATAEVVSLADLANEQFILLERGTDDEITPLFRRAGLAVRSKLSTWDDYAIMAMVEDGLGVSILPAPILRRCQFDVAVRPLEGHPHRQINAIYRTADVSLAAARFLEYLKMSAHRCRFGINLEVWLILFLKLNFRMRCRVILLPKLNLGSIRIL